jgi:hypothetical protein
MKTNNLEEARAAKSHAAQVFGRLATVAGVGITKVNEGYGLKINLQTAPAKGVSLPTEVDGVPVKIEVVGSIRKRA